MQPLLRVFRPAWFLAVAALVAACAGGAPTPITPRDTGTTSTVPLTPTVPIDDAAPDESDADQPLRAQLQGRVAAYLDWAIARGGACEGLACTFAEDGISFTVGVVSADGSTIEKLSLAATPETGGRLATASDGAIAATFTSLLTPLVDRELPRVGIEMKAHLSRPGTAVDLPGGTRLEFPAAPEGVDAASIRLVDVVVNEAGDRAASALPVDVGTVLLAYREQGFTCGDPTADTRPGYLATKCDRSSHGLTYRVALVTDDSGALVDGYAAVMRADRSPLSTADALDHLTGFTGVLLGPDLAEPAATWLATAVGQEYDEVELSDRLAIATYEGPDEDPSRLYVEIGSRAYLSAPTT